MFLWHHCDKKQPKPLMVCEKMFSSVVHSRKSVQDILGQKGPRMTKPPILFGCLAFDMHTGDNQTCSFTIFGADCLFIRMCAGCLAVPVVVWLDFAVRTFCFKLNIFLNSMKNQEINNADVPQQNANFLDEIFRVVLNGHSSISEPLDQVVEYYVSKYGRTEKAIDRMVAAQRMKLTASGFVLGLGGLITLPVTLPLDFASSLYVELRMIALIAGLRGYDIRSDEVKALMFACLVGNTIGDVIKQTGIKVANEFVVKKLLPKLTKEVIAKINKVVGFKLLAKGSKGLIKVTKCVPVVGGVIGGTYNYVEVSIVAKAAKKMFNENA